ncbi:MAG TPA: ATPase, T2SS/T4P/T4SS family [archaeon]|nr:ATPase, T2SS/T4P/T4SS family [archaeon]
MDSYDNIEITEEFPFNLYNVKAQELPQNERLIANALVQLILRKSSFHDLESVLGKNASLVEEIRSEIIQPIDAEEMLQKFPSTEALEKIGKTILGIAKKIQVKNPELFTQIVLDETLGFRSLSSFMRDNLLEEIMVNGFEKNVFVLHKRFGICKTNIVARKNGFLHETISRIAATANRQFSEHSPLLDARLPDGSRANATLQYVTPAGPSLTIRKFNPVPFSITDLLANSTLSSEAAAFLWTMIEGMNISPKNIIITGGAGSGKTSLLNVLSFFIRKHERIISIEDTIELDFAGRENWIQMESRPALHDIPSVSMDDLLKNSLRMRPDRLIVGEVRGEEAQTLFVAMDTGHEGILGTLHSNTAREMLLRLKSAPMNVPEQMLPLLDFVIVMQRRYNPEKGMQRRIKQIAEVSRMDDKVLLSNIFEFNEKKDAVEKTDVPSHVFEMLANECGMQKNDLKKEILIRQKILDWAFLEKKHSNSELEEIIQGYYYNPEKILKKVSESL